MWKSHPEYLISWCNQWTNSNNLPRWIHFLLAVWKAWPPTIDCLFLPYKSFHNSLHQGYLSIWKQRYHQWPWKPCYSRRAENMNTSCLSPMFFPFNRVWSAQISASVILHSLHNGGGSELHNCELCNCELLGTNTFSWKVIFICRNDWKRRWPVYTNIGCVKSMAMYNTWWRIPTFAWNIYLVLLTTLSEHFVRHTLRH